MDIRANLHGSRRVSNSLLHDELHARREDRRQKAVDDMLRAHRRSLKATMHNSPEEAKKAAAKSSHAQRLEREVNTDAGMGFVGGGVVGSLAGAAASDLLSHPGHILGGAALGAFTGAGIMGARRRMIHAGQHHYYDPHQERYVSVAESNRFFEAGYRIALATLRE